MARQLWPRTGAQREEERSGSPVLTVGGRQVFLSLENACGECGLASPMTGTKEGNCESFTGLTDQPMFRVQESVYRAGKQNR